MATINVATVSGTYDPGITGIPALSTTPQPVDVTLFPALLTAASAASKTLMSGSTVPGARRAHTPGGSPTAGTWTQGDEATDLVGNAYQYNGSTWTVETTGTGVTPAQLATYIKDRAIDFERDFAASITDWSASNRAAITAAWQAAITAALAAGGGKIRATARTYHVSNLNYGSPISYSTSPTKTVEIEGVFRQNVVPWGPGYGDSQPVLPGGTIFNSTATSGDVFGGTIGTQSNILAVFRNVIVRVPDNPNVNGLNLYWLLNCELDNVIVDTGQPYGGTAITQPTHTGVTGIALPGPGNGGYVVARNATAIGFPIGIMHSEHANLENVTAYKNAVGVQVVTGYHESHYGRLLTMYNTINWQAYQGSASPVTRVIGELDSEESTNTADWHYTTAHIDDPGNKARGYLKTHRVLAGVGIAHPVRRNGATYLNITPAGSLQRSMVDAIGFEGADSTTVLPNSLGVMAPTQHAGTWGIATKLAYRSASGGNACVAAWPTGHAQVLAHTKVTSSSTTSRTNAGLALNVVDASNYLAVAIINTATPSTLQIYKSDTGVLTSLASVTITTVPVSTTYDLAVVVRAGKVVVYLDGSQALTYTMSGAEWTKYQLGTAHGFYAYGSGAGNYDNGGTRWGFLRIESPGPVVA